MRCVAFKIEMPMVFLFFVYYPSDSKCVDQSERSMRYHEYLSRITGNDFSRQSKMDDSETNTETSKTFINVVAMRSVL